jgi:selenide,water dikinase
LPRLDNPRVLVGFDKSDDAGVYLLDDHTALVQTIDFFTPIVDDPEIFGQVAAANSLSDVYAMGGRPVTALAVTCYPGSGDPAVLAAIMRGGQSKIHEAGCVVIGGHSVADDEIKFGYAVIGTIDPARVRTNSAARPGDDLVLTKRLGTGVISTALKREIARPEHIDAMVESMTQLNRAAGEAMGRYNVHAATDITGFGLMGHGREMAEGSGVTLEIDHSRLEFLPGALDYARQGIFPGGQKNNQLFAQSLVGMAGTVPPEVAGLLYDPQTSGGLLISIAPADTGALLKELGAAGVVAVKVGRVLERTTPAIRVI